LRSLNKSPRAGLARRLPNLPLTFLSGRVFKGFSVIGAVNTFIEEFCVFPSIFKGGWLVLHGSGLERTVICFKKLLLKPPSIQWLRLYCRRFFGCGAEGLGFNVSFNLHGRFENGEGGA